MVTAVYHEPKLPSELINTTSPCNLIRELDNQCQEARVSYAAIIRQAFALDEAHKASKEFETWLYQEGKDGAIEGAGIGATVSGALGLIATFFNYAINWQSALLGTALSIAGGATIGYVMRRSFVHQATPSLTLAIKRINSQEHFRIRNINTSLNAKIFLVENNNSTKYNASEVTQMRDLKQIISVLLGTYTSKGTPSVGDLIEELQTNGINS